MIWISVLSNLNGRIIESFFYNIPGVGILYKWHANADPIFLSSLVFNTVTSSLESI